MSAETVDRWNAIPMVRQDASSSQANAAHEKRPRPDDAMDDDDDDDDGDDNMSIVSRSPSPPLPGESDITKYDEYIRKPEQEVITVETKIKSSNVGFALLARLGWKEGQPLGLSPDARVDPIPFNVKNDATGLGKINQDVEMIETTVSQRRELDSERMRKETADQRKAREDSMAKKEAVKAEIADTLRAFYCSLCEKQFQTVAQYDEHTNSYAHHHKARFRDMQQSAQRMVSQEEVDKRKEKERKREEKELRKLAKAQGIKFAKPATTSTSTPLAPATAAPPDATSEPKPPATGFKKAGWASVSSVAEPSPSRFAAAPATSSPPNTVPPSSTSGKHAPAPAFRNAGWTSLDTQSSSSATLPQSSAPPSAPPPPPESGPPPPPYAPPSSSGWASQVFVATVEKRGRA
ncbi:hypothetical protein CONPUDRAFT_133930 [Coniophora puteana RWD-64-598 SS2]|uniref:G-patch domain-containing protein n=1 Tax=Coniophora puteana (strain RWD-64-598) TaxID=741705 RepID=A0A5M3N518_CONPW|nr:uncharacterized protein CONPUDRAFT_133930 [Coniophora puteana RWD-64-598 SS2]EIW86509.1 hypothetical protein CONPUDRAFT_133930 [Coniophora puteana RWD-64-598 SS2]